ESAELRTSIGEPKEIAEIRMGHLRLHRLKYTSGEEKVVLFHRISAESVVYREISYLLGLAELEVGERIPFPLPSLAKGVSARAEYGDSANISIRFDNPLVHSERDNTHVNGEVSTRSLKWSSRVVWPYSGVDISVVTLRMRPQGDRETFKLLSLEKSSQKTVRSRIGSSPAGRFLSMNYGDFVAEMAYLYGLNIDTFGDDYIYTLTSENLRDSGRYAFFLPVYKGEELDFIVINHQVRNGEQEPEATWVGLLSEARVRNYYNFEPGKTLELDQGVSIRWDKETGIQAVAKPQTIDVDEVIVDLKAKIDVWANNIHKGFRKNEQETHIEFSVLTGALFGPTREIGMMLKEFFDLNWLKRRVRSTQNSLELSGMMAIEEENLAKLQEFLRLYRKEILTIQAMIDTFVTEELYRLH
ncbi:MAG: hypothetical protein AAF202_10505, partial [Pseudomonadota bacterium]